MGRGVGPVGLSAESKRTPAEGRRGSHAYVPGVLLGSAWFQLARAICDRAAFRFALCRPTYFAALPLCVVSNEGLGRLSAARCGRRLATVAARDFQRGDWAQRRLCGGMPLVVNPSWAVSFEAPLDGTRTFDWCLTIQARVISRVVFYGLPCCLPWSHVALGMGPAK